MSASTSPHRASSDIVTPPPQHIRLRPGTVPLGPLVLPKDRSDEGWALTVLRRGLKRLGLPEPRAEMPSGPHTVLRLATARATCRELIERCRAEFGKDCALQRLTHEGYALEAQHDGTVNRVTIAATGGAGLAYGVDTFLQLIESVEGEARLRKGLICDHPAVRIRVYGGSGSLDEAAAMRFNMRGGGGTVEEIAEMRVRHIEPWTSVHPSHAYAGEPGLRYSDEHAVERAIAPIVEAATRGVKWVGMSFDDIDLRLPHADDRKRYGTIGKAHAAFINHTLSRVRQANPEAQLTVIPVIYANNWLPGTWVYAVDEQENYDYLQTLGREVDPSVVFIWTGESVESVSMTDDDIRQWVDLVGRKPVVFENTPTGDLTDFGALRLRTRNVGDLLDGWIYIHRGPQAAIAEVSTAEYLWNPKAYDPSAALKRAIRKTVGDAAAPEMERLITSFTAHDDRASDPRYRHPIWREGRLLEIVESDDPAVAEFYESRLETITTSVPVLDRLIRDNPFYRAVRKVALANLDIAHAYLDTYALIRSAERGDTAEALRAGDRAQALFEEWNRSSSGTTDLSAPSEGRDAMTYIEQVEVARRLRVLRRGGEEPIPWVLTPGQQTRFGRRCTVLSAKGETVEVPLRASQRSSKWLLLTGCGDPDSPIRLDINTAQIPVPAGVWQAGRWCTVAVPLPSVRRQYTVTVRAAEACDWALHRAALLENPEAAFVLHATRSSAVAGDETRLTEPTRHLRHVTTPHVTGRVAVRPDIEIRRGVSGGFFRLAPGDVVGQTVHLPPEGEHAPAPKDPIRLITREPSDGDFLASVGVMFQQHGPTPLALSLWRWAGSPGGTTSHAGNRVATSAGKPGTPFGPSHHWIEFPLAVEFDPGTTYYFELSAPEGWDGWRLRQSYGWYGHRCDPLRSAYLNGEMLTGADIPFTTYVWDVYDAEWNR